MTRYPYDPRRASALLAEGGLAPVGAGLTGVVPNTGTAYRGFILHTWTARERVSPTRDYRTYGSEAVSSDEDRVGGPVWSPSVEQRVEVDDHAGEVDGLHLAAGVEGLGIAPIRLPPPCGEGAIERMNAPDLEIAAALVFW